MAQADFTAPLRSLLPFLSLAVCYFIAAVAGLNWATISGAASPVWPASGVAVAGLLIGGRALWPAICLGMVAAYLATGATMPFWAQLLIGLGDAVAAVTATAIIQRLGGGLTTGLRETVAFLAGTAAASVLAATIGTLALSAPNGFSDPVLHTWTSWVFGYVAGALVFGSAIIAWWKPISLLPEPNLSHFGLALAATLLVSAVVFADDTPQANAWYVYPPLIWVALALRFRGAAVALVFVTAAGVSGTTLGYGPFSAEADGQDLVLLQQFLSVTAAVTLLLASIADERRAEGRLREMADAMPIVVWTARGDGYTDYYNEQWYAYTGMTRGEGGEPGWTPAIHPDDLPRCLDAWHGSLRTGDPYQIEYRFRHGETGEYRWHLGRASAGRDSTGKVVRWYGTGTDIHDLRLSQEALATSLKNAELLLYEVNHRVKNSLQLVNSLLLLESSKIDEPTAKAAVLGARQKINAVAQLHRQLYVDGLHASVDFSRYATGAVEEMQRAVGQEVKLVFKAAGPPAILPIRQAAPIALVLTELVTNAIKHAFPERGGRIEVSVESGSDELNVTIADNGIGLPANFSVAASTSIGMQITSGLVEQAGGSLEILERRNGAAFRVVVPLGDPS